MKIGIIGDALDKQYAGVHYFTKNIVKSLSEIDPKNEYYIFRRKKGEIYDNAVEIIIPTTKWIPGYQSLRFFLMIPWKARELNLDIVIEPAHFGPFNLPKRIKRVTVIHDLTPLMFRQWHTFNGWFLQKLFLPGIIKRADLIITNSYYTKQDIVNFIGLSENMIVASHLGISGIFKKVIDPLVLGKYGIYKKYILYQGTLEPRKNLVNLIKAYEVYRQSYPEKEEQLILSGKKGWKIEEIVKMKYDSPYKDDIILLGYVKREDMPAIYSGAEVFVYPSLYEGFGLPVLEAMACGVPIVTSDRSSLPEVGGKYATYLDPYDIEGLAMAIASAHKKLHLLNEQMDYAQSFTWEKTAERILGALENLR